MASTIRFTGLSSGLDTESIVQSLLTPYQSKIDKVKANNTMAEWRKDAYKELSLKISNFRTKTMSKLTNLSQLNQSKATLSQEGAIKIDTSKYTEDGTHTIEVKQVASKATVNTKTINNKDQTIKGSSAVTDINGINDKDVLKIKYGTGAEKTFNLEGKTVSQLTKEIETAFTTDGNKNVTCKFDENIGAFIINSATTGTDEVIDFSGTNETVLNALGIQKNSESSNYSFSGKNAEVVYNGGVTISQASNEIEVNGIKFTAVSKTDQPVTVNISKDIDSLINTVVSVVDEYNSLISEMSTKLYADSAKGYDPLTEDEKEAMTEKEIETWENKIKDSLFRNDSTLRGLYNGLRDAMTGSYEGQKGIDKSCNMLSQLGISASAWTDRGKLTVDEEKLREALTNNGDNALKLLNTIANNIDEQLMNASKSTENRSYGQFFSDKIQTNNIAQYAKDLINAQEKYDKMETMYYTKFTAMEKAMNNMNSQSSLFSQL